jgi:hypothetical protein
MAPTTRLREVLSYDPETGNLTRLAGKGPRAITGTNARGYIQLQVDGQFYYGHRLAWWFVHDEWPKQLDHINGDPSDNRIANLRLASPAQNAANMRRKRVGLKGAFRKRQKWISQIMANGKLHRLGVFKDEQSAHAAYCEAAERLHAEFARFD